MTFSWRETPRKTNITDKRAIWARCSVCQVPHSIWTYENRSNIFFICKKLLPLISCCKIRHVKWKVEHCLQLGISTGQQHSWSFGIESHRHSNIIQRKMIMKIWVMLQPSLTFSVKRITGSMRQWCITLTDKMINKPLKNKAISVYWQWCRARLKKTPLDWKCRAKLKCWFRKLSMNLKQNPRRVNQTHLICLLVNWWKWAIYKEAVWHQVVRSMQISANLID